jgi:hypothetical protein
MPSHVANTRGTPPQCTLKDTRGGARGGLFSPPHYTPNPLCSSSCTCTVLLHCFHAMVPSTVLLLALCRLGGAHLHDNTHPAASGHTHLTTNPYSPHPHLPACTLCTSMPPAPATPPEHARGHWEHTHTEHTTPTSAHACITCRNTEQAHCTPHPRRCTSSAAPIFP